MPASMIMALVGFIWNVSGSSMAIVAGGPSPGITPTTVPRNTPAKHQARFTGVSATAKPWRSPPSTSTGQNPNTPRGSATPRASGNNR
jgi:hypothetical protein